MKKRYCPLLIPPAVSLLVVSIIVAFYHRNPTVEEKNVKRFINSSSTVVLSTTTKPESTTTTFESIYTATPEKIFTPEPAKEQYFFHQRRRLTFLSVKLVLPQTTMIGRKRYNTSDSANIRNDVYFHNASLCDALAEHRSIKCGYTQGSYYKKQNSIWLKSRRQSIEIQPAPTLTVPRDRIRDIRDFGMLEYVPKGFALNSMYIYPDAALEYLLRFLEYDLSDSTWEKVTRNDTATVKSKLTQKVKQYQ